MNKKYIAIILYTASAVTVGGYFFTEATLTKLLLLCAACGTMWLGGVCYSKFAKNNEAMQINLKIYLGLFLMFFAELTLFDPAWGREGVNFGENLNLVPFKTITEIALNGKLRAIFVNLAGNIVCLMPLGILLPLNFRKQENILVFLGTTAAIVIAVEVLQLVLGVGVCDIDDLILNIFGAYLLYAFVKIKDANKILRRIFLLEKGETE